MEFPSAEGHSIEFFIIFVYIECVIYIYIIYTLRNKIRNLEIIQIQFDPQYFILVLCRGCQTCLPCQGCRHSRKMGQDKRNSVSEKELEKQKKEQEKLQKKQEKEAKKRAKKKDDTLRSNKDDTLRNKKEITV